jgi:hypothetical protein
MSIRKIASVALVVAVLVAAAPVAKAQSTSDLQAQISALLAQISQLQSQLGTSSGGSMSSYSFTRDLTVGSKGDDVKALQQFLNSHGAQIAASGAGSPGSESTYFGSLTKAALAKWQAANGVSPASGYFGPITRAKINGMGGSTGGSTGGNTGGVSIPGAGLSVSLSSQNPGAGTLISSSGSAAARVPVLAVNLTAGSASGMTVNELRFRKMGVLSDSSISGAYLVENGKVVAQYNSITAGEIVFSNLGWNIAAGQTRSLWLAIDPAAGLSAGNSVSFALESASKVVAVDANNAAAAVSGVFPLNGNIFTVSSVSNPSLATLAITSSSLGTSVTAGTQQNRVGAWNFSVANSKVWLKGVNFKVIGSANKNDLRNVTLKINGAQVGSTLTSVAADGTAYFDLSGTSATLNTGSNNVEVYADIAGSPSYNFQFEILNSYDVYAVDSQYGVPVSTNSNTGTQISILTGSITVSLATDSPNGNIAAGQSNVTVAKFTIYAAGEAVKVKWLGWGLNLTGATTSIDNLFRNVSLVDDAGGQVGSTVNTLSTSVTCTNTAFANTSTTYRNCFGNSSSPINYIVPANTTRVLSLKADVQSTANFTSVVGLLTGNTSNLQGLISSQTASSASVNGTSRSLATSALSVSQNSGVGTQTVAAPSTNRKIGSYILSASSAEGVNLSNITVTVGAAGADYSNLRLTLGGASFGTTWSVLQANTAYTFSGNASIATGQSVVVDVWADVLSSAAGTDSTITTLSSCSANGATSLSTVSCSSTAGQSVVIGGQATLTVSVDSGATPIANQVVMGGTQVPLATFRFSETSNTEDIQIRNLTIFQQVASTTTVAPAFSNLKLYSSTGTLVETYTGQKYTSVATSTPGAGYYWKFNFTNPLVVPLGQGVSYTLKGDVSTYANSAATDNTTHIFKIATSTDTDNDTIGETIVASGLTSQASSAIALSSTAAPAGNAQTVVRGKLNLSAVSLKSGTVTRQANDALANITLTAEGNSVVVNTIVITLSGAANTSTLPATFLLYDSNSSGVLGSNARGTLATTTTTTVTFSGLNLIVSPGAPAYVGVQANTQNTLNAASVTDGLGLTIATPSTDVRYTTAESGGTANVGLWNPSSLTIANITFE